MSVRCTPLITAALLVVAMPCHADESITVDFDAVKRNNPMPGDSRLNDALKSMRPEMERALKAAPAKPVAMPEPAKASPLPKTSAQGVTVTAPTAPIVPPHLIVRPERAGAFDPGALSNAYAAISRPASAATDVEFLVFVSLSIPPGELKKLIESAEEAKAVIVFRGPLDESDTSLRKFVAKIQMLGIKRAGDIEINPPAFTRYRVERVPTFVLAKVIENAAAPNACAPPGSYASVSGVAAPEFALNVMKSRARADIGAAAERYLVALKARRG